MDIIIEKLKNSEWAKYKKIRLEAVKKEPFAFGGSYSEELKNTDKEWKEKLKKANSEEISLMLFAKDRAEVVGMIGIYWSNLDKIKHGVNIYGLYVVEKYRNKGIGKILMQSIVDIVKSRSQFIKLYLYVETNQKKAISLYKKFGFRIVGELEKSMFINGKYVNSFLMEKVVKK